MFFLSFFFSDNHQNRTWSQSLYYSSCKRRNTCILFRQRIRNGKTCHLCLEDYVPESNLAPMSFFDVLDEDQTVPNDCADIAEWTFVVYFYLYLHERQFGAFGGYGFYRRMWSAQSIRMMDILWRMLVIADLNERMRPRRTVARSTIYVSRAWKTTTGFLTPMAICDCEGQKQRAWL